MSEKYAEMEEELDCILSLAEEFCLKHGIAHLSATVIIETNEIYSSGFSQAINLDVTRNQLREEK